MLTDRFGVPWLVNISPAAGVTGCTVPLYGHTVAYGGGAHTRSPIDGHRVPWTARGGPPGPPRGAARWPWTARAVALDGPRWPWTAVDGRENRRPDGGDLARPVGRSAPAGRATVMRPPWDGALAMPAPDATVSLPLLVVHGYPRRDLDRSSYASNRERRL